MNYTEMYINLVCEHVKLPRELVTSKCRKHEYCEARQVASFILLKHTTMSLQEVASELNYKDHASPWRDKRQVGMFLEIDRRFAAKYNPLIEKAKELAASIERQQEVAGFVAVPGDICWFWNLPLGFPVLGMLKKIYRNEEQDLRFMTPDGTVYKHCVYAGSTVLPEQFKSIENEMQPVPDEMFYEDSLIEKDCKASAIQVTETIAV